jgi:hypothetical protein
MDGDLMAGTVKASTIQHDVSGAATVFKDGAGTEIGQLCKAWLQVGGGTSVTAGNISGSFNISSVTVNGTGDQTASFTTSVASSAYAGMTRGDIYTSTSVASSGVVSATPSYYQAGSFRYAHQQAASFSTFTYMSIAIFR